MNTNENFEMELDLIKLFGIIKKIWHYCVLLVLICMTLAFGITKFFIPKTYQAEAKVIVVSKNEGSANAQLSYTDLQLSQKLVATYTQIIMSERISDIVIERMGDVLTTKDYNSMVRVTAQQNTEIMKISVISKDPVFSSELANQVIDVFLTEINHIMPVENVSILNSAKVPTINIGPRVLLNTAVGAVLGILMSGLLCMFVLLTDRKIKDTDDIKGIINAPLIGAIPYIDAEEDDDTGPNVDRSLVTIYDSNSVVSEAYRSLRTNITLRNFDNDIKVINVVSSSQAEGKSSAILNLAVVFGQIGKKVLIIDLDLRAPTIHRKLKIKNGFGITDLINKQAVLKDCILDYNENIDVITAGTKIPFASEFLQSVSLKKFIDEAKERYDFVLLDSPPAGLVTDGTIVSKIADGTIIVVASNSSEKKDLQTLDELLRQFDINILGVVMTRMPMSKKYGYYYTYSDVKP